MEGRPCLKPFGTSSPASVLRRPGCWLQPKTPCGCRDKNRSARGHRIVVVFRVMRDVPASTFRRHLMLDSAVTRSRTQANRLTKSSAVWATSRQPWSIVREWPRFGIFTISVTAGLRRCRL